MMRKYLCAITIALFGITGCATINKKAASSNSHPDFIPRLKRPEVRKVWVPDQIVGDEYVSGHWKFVLEKNAVWTKEN